MDISQHYRALVMHSVFQEPWFSNMWALFKHSAKFFGIVFFVLFCMFACMHKNLLCPYLQNYPNFHYATLTSFLFFSFLFGLIGT